MNGSVTNVAGSGAVYMLTITPDGMGDIEITIPADVVMIGNIGNPASETLIVHYGAPITVGVSDAPALAGGSSSPFTVTTITFSESVTGFDAEGDITVTNGMAAAPVAMGVMAEHHILTMRRMAWAILRSLSRRVLPKATPAEPLRPRQNR
ncbi:MAG: hypothetical protein ACNYPI_01330 [Arenicellales bacterium WSBS_2016_MAG_OTU3]